MTDPLRFPVLLEALANGRTRATGITVSIASTAMTRQDALDGITEAIRRKMVRLVAAGDTKFWMRDLPAGLHKLWSNDKPRFFHAWVAAMVAQGSGETFEPYEASIVLLPMPESAPAPKRTAGEEFDRRAF
jgi:hypothetical protein